MVEPIATIREDTLILEVLKANSIVTDKQINQARKIVRGLSDYKKLTDKRRKPSKAHKAKHNG